MARRFLWGILLGWLLACPVLLRAEIMIDDHENWDYIITKFDDFLSHSKTLDQELEVFVNKELTRFSTTRRQIEKRASELDFLLTRENYHNVFGIALYCKQIEDLLVWLNRSMEPLQQVKNALQNSSERLQGIKPLLVAVKQHNDSSYINRQSQLHIDTCINGIAPLEQKMAANLVRIDNEKKCGEELRARLLELNKRGEERRSKVIREIIFSRQSTFLNVLPIAASLFRDWFYNIEKWLLVEFSNDWDFWIGFFAMIGLAGTPLYFLGARVFNWIASRVDFPDRNRKQRLFMTGWLLFILSLFFLGARLALSELESTPMFMLGKLLLCSSGIVIAIAFRTRSEAVKRTLWLYAPLLFQHVAGMMCCLLLIPYLQLILVCPVLNLPVVVAVIWLLCCYRYDLIDTICAFVTLVIGLASALLSMYGLSYIAFTLTLSWFVAVSGILFGLSMTTLVRKYIAANADRRIMACLLLTLISPIMWLAIAGGIIYWIAGLYNQQRRLLELLQCEFSLKNWLNVSAVDIMTCLIVALVLQFAISSVRYILEITFGDRANAGIIPSFLTLGIYLTWCFYVLFFLAMLHVHYSGILAVLGGMSIGFGFGMKETVSNFLAGIGLLMGQQLRPGDVVEVGGVWGLVRKINVRATVIETNDHAVITYPNAVVISKDFRNWTSNNNLMRKDIPVSVALNSDIEKIKQLLLDVAADEPGVITSPAPNVFLSELGAETMTFILSVIIDVHRREQTSGRLREAIARILPVNGIKLGKPGKSD